MLFPFARKPFLTSLYVDANFLGVIFQHKNESCWIDRNNHNMIVLLATPVVLVDLFLLLGDRKINVNFYTQFDMTGMLATLDFIGSEFLGSLQSSFEYSLGNANFIVNCLLS